MVSEPEGKVKRTSRADEVKEEDEGLPEQAIEVVPSPEAMVPPVPQPTPEQKAFAEALSDVLVKAQELAFELATLNCRLAPNCPLVKKSRELIVELKKMIEIGKKMSRTAPATPTQ
jgi:hypothetical protein